MEHHFDVEIAKEYGILEAVILNHFQFWIKRNMANGINYYDGFYWTYNSTKAFSEIFPYASQKQIRTALQHLINEGIIQTGNYNSKAYDRTLWYAFTEKGNSICPVGKMQMTVRENANDREGNPIPDINTDNKTTDTKKVRKNRQKPKSYDEQIEEYTQNDDLKTALKAFVQMRSFIKKPMTEYALKLMLKKLDGLAKDDETKTAIVNNAVEHNWQGIYPLKEEQTYSYKKPVPDNKKTTDQIDYSLPEEYAKLLRGE